MVFKRNMIYLRTSGYDIDYDIVNEKRNVLYKILRRR